MSSTDSFSGAHAAAEMLSEDFATKGLLELRSESRQISATHPAQPPPAPRAANVDEAPEAGDERQGDRGHRIRPARNIDRS
jgi:hypothetical protein